MMATVDTGMPIWDQYVIRNIGFNKKWEKFRAATSDERITVATEIYRGIQKWYNDFSSSKNGKACIIAFDLALPAYKDRLCSVKKIDYML